MCSIFIIAYCSPISMSVLSYVYRRTSSSCSPRHLEFADCCTNCIRCLQSAKHPSLLQPLNLEFTVCHSLHDELTLQVPTPLLLALVSDACPLTQRVANGCLLSWLVASLNAYKDVDLCLPTFCCKVNQRRKQITK